MALARLPREGDDVIDSLFIPLNAVDEFTEGCTVVLLVDGR